MAIPDLRKPGEAIDCMATVGDGEPVRGFLQLPSDAGPGLLRLVEPGGVQFGETTGSIGSRSICSRARINSAVVGLPPVVQRQKLTVGAKVALD